jgi:hypothetical protein
MAAGVAPAYTPSVADLDAAARAVGNRRDIAMRIGETIFATRWPAEVSQVSANQLAGHLIVGLRVWGIKFHRPLTRDEFVGEIVALIAKAFAAAPGTEEIDVWASVPVNVVRGEVVSGDLAEPTSRTVFSLTVRRGEPPASTKMRASRVNEGAFWNAQWAKSAFREPT